MMNCIVLRDDLLVAAKEAARVVEKRTSIPILSYVLLNANGKLEVMATDQETSIAAETQCNTREQGVITLSADKLVKILTKGFSKGTSVEITERANRMVELACGRTKFELYGLDPGDYPAVTFAKPDDWCIMLSTATLEEALRHVRFAVYKDLGRPNLCTVLFQADADVLRFIGTDGHRLSLFERKDDSARTLQSVLLPAPFVEELARMAKGVNPVVLSVRTLIEYKDQATGKKHKDPVKVSHVFADNGSVRVATRVEVQAEDYPDYTQVIPRKSITDVTVSAAEMLECVQRMMLIANERTHGIKLNIADGSVQFSAMNPDYGNASDNLPATVDGPPLTVGYNATYLVECLKILPDGADAIFAFQDDRPSAEQLAKERVLNGDAAPKPAGVNEVVSPATITSPQVPGFLHVLMPMRL